MLIESGQEEAFIKELQHAAQTQFSNPEKLTGPIDERQLHYWNHLVSDALDRDLEKYKRQLGTGVFALMGTAGMSVFSKRELISLLSEQAKSLRPVYAMFDERLEHLKSELAQKNQIFKRGNDACYERRLVA